MNEKRIDFIKKSLEEQNGQLYEDETFNKIKEIARKEAQQIETAIKEMMIHYKIGMQDLKQRVEAVTTSKGERRINGSNEEKTEYYVAGEKALTVIRRQRPSEKGYGIIVTQKVIKHWEE